MKRMLMTVLLVLMTGSAWGNDTLTGHYETKQKNLTGTMKILLLPDNTVRFEVQTVKRGAGDYKGSGTTCSAEGVAKLKGSVATYVDPEPLGDRVFAVKLSFGKNKVEFKSNEDETNQCGMGAWLDGAYRKKDGDIPTFIQ